MPIYEYSCEECGVFEEVVLSPDDEPDECPRCYRPVTRVNVSLCAFRLAGGGWAADGYEKRESTE